MGISKLITGSIFLSNSKCSPAFAAQFSPEGLQCCSCVALHLQFGVIQWQNCSKLLMLLLTGQL